MINMIAIFAASTAEGRRVTPCSIMLAARGAVPRRRIHYRRSGEAIPRDRAASCRPSSNLLASGARALFPIARATSRGLAQPGFNEIAQCVPFAAVLAYGPRRRGSRDLAETLVLSIVV